jgi:hypothetical protein
MTCLFDVTLSSLESIKREMVTLTYSSITHEYLTPSSCNKYITMPSPEKSPTNSKPTPSQHHSYPTSAPSSAKRPPRRVAMFSEPTVGGTSSSDEDDEPRASSSNHDHDSEWLNCAMPQVELTLSHFIR